MNRNVESHFALNPTNIDIRRSTFDRSHSLKTSFNVGDIVPFFLDEVLPGDTFNVDTSKVVRLQTLLTPVMDNIYLDTYFFFVPNRLTWSHWKQFNGENTESAWIPQTEYEIPQITAPADAGWSVGTIADYLGVPTGVPNLSVSALPFRAYAASKYATDQQILNPNGPWGFARELLKMVSGDEGSAGLGSSGKSLFNSISTWLSSASSDVKKAVFNSDWYRWLFGGVNSGGFTHLKNDGKF